MVCLCVSGCVSPSPLYCDIEDAKSPSRYTGLPGQGGGGKGGGGGRLRWLVWWVDRQGEALSQPQILLMEVVFCLINPPIPISPPSRESPGLKSARHFKCWSGCVWLAGWGRVMRRWVEGGVSFWWKTRKSWVVWCVCVIRTELSICVLLLFLIGHWLCLVN